MVGEGVEGLVAGSFTDIEARSGLVNGAALVKVAASGAPARADGQTGKEPVFIRA